MLRITAAVLTVAACLTQVSTRGTGVHHGGAAPHVAPISHSFFVAGPDFTGIIDDLGRTQWAAPRARARDGWVLENGNILIAWSDEVLEFRYGSHDVVWRYALQEPNQEIGTAQRLDDGLTLVTELGPEPRIVEVDTAGNEVHAIVLQPETENAHMQTRMGRRTKSGQYRMPHLLAFAVKLYSPDGEVVQAIATDLEELGGREAKNWPFTAIDLPNGHVLVGCTHGNKVVEFTADGKVAWVLRNVEVGGLMNDACGVQRLPNGHTVVASYNASSGPKLFEVDRDKNVVWTYTGPHRAHHFQILTTNGQPLPGPPLR